MALTNRDPNKEGSPYWKIIFGVFLGVGLTFAASQIFNHSKESDSNVSESSAPASLESSGGEAANLTAPPSPYQDPIGREERALAVTKLERYREQAKSVYEAVKVLEKELGLWEVEIEPLLFNEDGKWLASDEALVRYFQKLMTEERMSPITVSSIRTQVDEILTPVLQAIQDPNELYVPSLEMSKTLTKLHTDAYHGAKNYQKLRSQVMAMVEDAKSNNDKATFSLQTALARLEGGKARLRAELLAEEEKKAEEEIAQQLAEVRKQTLEKEAEAERKILLERQKTAEQEAALEAKNLEEQRFRKMAADLNVQREFAVFLKESNLVLKSVPKVNPGNYYTREVFFSKALRWKYDTKISVSNAYLITLGVYSNFDDFVTVVTSKFGSTSPGVNRYNYFYNDRPIWPKPKTKSDWDKYREKWELFRKLSPYWLESGVLHN